MEVMLTPSVSIRIISRYVPIAYRAGHFTYLLELMRYLHQQGFQIELDVLDPWFLSENIPEYIKRIAHVVIMPMSFLQTPQSRSEQRIMRAWLRPFYEYLPTPLIAPLRSQWYRIRKRDIPGHHLPDAIATEAEIAFIKDRMACQRPHILIANETFLGNVLKACQEKQALLKISLALDLHHQRQEQFRQTELSGVFSPWSREKEIDQLKAADVIVAIHEDDANTLREMLPHTEVMCAPFPAHVQPHDKAEQIAGCCLFVGSSIATNIQGMTWFLREVWPLVLQQQPQAILHVCGAVCEALTRFIAPNVRLLGRVEEISSEYGAAEVCLIPLLAGSGLKIKLVEALAHGRACVSMPVGVQGVQELADNTVLVADQPEEFAAAVASLLQQPERRNRMEAEAQRYVVEQLAPENVYHPFVQCISQHLLQKTANRS